MRTNSLGLAMGGTTGKPVPFAPISLYDALGRPNLSHVASCAVHRDRTINIADAYAADDFDFSGTRTFDRDTGYRSRSCLTVPLKDHEGAVIGVLQLINARHERGDVDEAAPFTPADQRLAQSLASQAAVALSSQRLVADMQRLFDSIVRLIATAIDERSPHTAGHCERVPALTTHLAEAAHRSTEGAFERFRLTERDRYELEVASWLYDCGKLTTPDHIIEKSTKLQTIFDRIDLIDTRFELLKRDVRIEHLERTVAVLRDPHRTGLEPDLQAECEAALQRLDRDRDSLRRCNRHRTGPFGGRP